MADSQEERNLELGFSSPRDRHTRRWVRADPADTARSDALAATVHTPENLGVREYASEAPSLIVLAATLGVSLVAGERLLEGSNIDNTDLLEPSDDVPNAGILLDDTDMED
jgi:hypothetical protein